MNILYITLSNPRLNETGIYPDLVHALTDKGHSMTIVYAAGSSGDSGTVVTEEYGVKLLKVKTGDNFGVGFIKKGINTLMLEPLLKKAIKTYLADEKYDLCIYATPPVTFAGVVEYCKKKYGLKTFLMLKDIFPQNAVDIGLFGNGSIVHKMFRLKEEKLYRISDVIGVMSKGNMEYIKKHNPDVDEEKIIIFPNTVKVLPVIDNKTDDNSEKVKFVFGGNLGKPQAIDFLIKAIGVERVKSLNAEFIFIGEGSEKSKVAEAAKRLDNLTFINHMPKDEYDKFMAGCDVGIISLDHRFTIPNYPSRILGYMSMAKPILACTDEVTDIHSLVETDAECGMWCSSDDVDGFCECIKKMCEDREALKKMGANGRKYLEEYFDVERSVEILEKNS